MSAPLIAFFPFFVITPDRFLRPARSLPAREKPLDVLLRNRRHISQRRGLEVHLREMVELDRSDRGFLDRLSDDDDAMAAQDAQVAGAHDREHLVNLLDRMKREAALVHRNAA